MMQNIVKSLKYQQCICNITGYQHYYHNFGREDSKLNIFNIIITYLLTHFPHTAPMEQNVFPALWAKRIRLYWAIYLFTFLTSGVFSHLW